jgi:hypothetical protein
MWEYMVNEIHSIILCGIDQFNLTFWLVKNMTSLKKAKWWLHHRIAHFFSNMSIEIEKKQNSPAILKMSKLLGRTFIIGVSDCFILCIFHLCTKKQEKMQNVYYMIFFGLKWVSFWSIPKAGFDPMTSN